MPPSSSSFLAGRQARLRIGMISPLWLPRFGGAEQYEYRLAETLRGLGHEVQVFCGTPEDPKRFNGHLATTRHTPLGAIDFASWADVFWADANDDERGEARGKMIAQLDFMEAASRWLGANRFDIVMIGNILQLRSSAHARELYASAKATSAAVGAFHYDICHELEEMLRRTYITHDRDWLKTRQVVNLALENIHRRSHPLEFFWVYGSPLFFRPDFVVSCSEWSSAFMDPAGLTPKFALHPIIDSRYWRAKPAAGGLAPVDVLMINPQLRKNPEAMVGLIHLSPPETTFRVLKGGWGDAFKKFREKIETSTAFRQGRIELLDYVEDMRQAYRSARLVFFPSYVEGYGQTAIEPMYAGVPVVSSNYPAVREAVGEGALALCPHTSTALDWVRAVRSVLRDHESWSRRALARADELEARQSDEIASFVEFLWRMKESAPRT